MSDLEPKLPEVPFPIFRISASIERYMLYDINLVTWLRKTQHILGVLIGTLPHVPQQNVFLGLPLEIMPEEAMLLVEKGLAYVVGDFEWEREGLKSGTVEHRQLYIDRLLQEGAKAADFVQQVKLQNMEKAMQRLNLGTQPIRSGVVELAQEVDPDKSAFDGESKESPRSTTQPPLQARQKQFAVTPATAVPMLDNPPSNSRVEMPAVRQSSYAVFKKLHSNGYYISPGLRFGCQFMAYPGDPLRYHSHFLTVGVDWDEEVDLIDVVGGGRLGTGVKKAFLIGGVEPKKFQQQERTRTFCIEWGGM